MTRTFKRETTARLKPPSWDALQVVESLTLSHAAELGWYKPTVSVRVTDTGGSYRTQSVAAARETDSATRHEVKDVDIDVSESIKVPGEPYYRSVYAYLYEGTEGRPVYVQGPVEAEVIGLTGVIDEMLQTPVSAQPPSVTPRSIDEQGSSVPASRQNSVLYWFRDRTFWQNVLAGVVVLGIAALITIATILSTK